MPDDRGCLGIDAAACRPATKWCASRQSSALFNPRRRAVDAHTCSRRLLRGCGRRTRGDEFAAGMDCPAGGDFARGAGASGLHQGSSFRSPCGAWTACVLRICKSVVPQPLSPRGARSTCGAPRGAGAFWKWINRSRDDSFLAGCLTIGLRASNVATSPNAVAWPQSWPGKNLRL